ncbi:two-component system response regulator YesN [Paenibacillus endophyticus]|uniref:Two-component system response regulator YesN n=1 Tax=Paenibacillus endophyticus TaxID=1294268 RepID=A0A7W5CAH5_9BACL|nr:response regulator [Paenibacillus endophyticus]MBB3153139.1 two-component system response regulator YesN [Paenibacillus endophyticus]
MHKVLIIDDEPWSREVIKALGQWDVMNMTVVGEAEDGKSGLRSIEELAPHIVVTDMRMPGVDGVELLQQMNEQFPQVKIIVMSGYDDFAYMKQAIRSRAAEYLLKPVDPDELIAALRKCAAELEAASGTDEQARTIPLPFPSKALSDRYLSLKQRTLAALFELNKPAVLQNLGKLEQLLAETFHEGLSHKQLERLYEDYAALLEQFLGEYNLGEQIVSPDSMRLPTNLSDRIEVIGFIYSTAIERIEATLKKRGNLLIGEVKAYLDKHFLDPISLESVAQQFYVSKEHLSRSFKAARDETITDYIIGKRMDHARNLLLLPHVSIKEAALLSGYTELPYFHRVFKKHFGMTPGEVRNSKPE